MSAVEEKKEETTSVAAEVTETSAENAKEKQVVSETASSEELDAEKTHVPMTLKRFLALLSLVWLITTSATPIIFIGATLSMP